MLDRIAAFSPDNKYPGHRACVSKIGCIRGATSSVDRALVSGTKGPGFDPRVALQGVSRTYPLLDKSFLIHLACGG